MDSTRLWMDLASRGIEALAVLIMMCLIGFATVRWVYHTWTGATTAYERFRVVLGKTLLLGLELLVAADIIRTVAFELTMLNVAMLGALVVVRTFLGWTLTVEVEGHWPWRKEPSGAAGAEGTSAPAEVARLAPLEPHHPIQG
jgi:uncharacterized membrane protein